MENNTNKQEVKRQFVFERKNYKLLIIGLVINIIGFILMIGGAASSPDEFNEEALFSPVRLTLAPILVVAGYGIILYSIIAKPKK